MNNGHSTAIYPEPTVLNGVARMNTEKESAAKPAQPAPPPVWYTAAYGVAFFLGAVMLFFGSAAAAGVWYRVAHAVAGG